MHELNEHDRAQLSLLAALPDGAALPEELVVQFCRVKKLAARLGVTILPAELYILAGLYAGMGWEQQPEPQGLEQWLQSGRLQINDTIAVSWRGGREEAIYLGRRSWDGRVRLLFPGKQKEQTVDPKHVLGVVETAEA